MIALWLVCRSTSLPRVNIVLGAKSPIQGMWVCWQQPTLPQLLRGGWGWRECKRWLHWVGIFEAIYSDRDKSWPICYMTSQGKLVKTYPNVSQWEIKKGCVGPHHHAFKNYYSIIWIHPIICLTTRNEEPQTCCFHSDGVWMTRLWMLNWWDLVQGW